MIGSYSFKSKYVLFYNTDQDGMCEIESDHVMSLFYISTMLIVMGNLFLTRATHLEAYIDMWLIVLSR